MLPGQITSTPTNPEEPSVAPLPALCGSVHRTSRRFIRSPVLLRRRGNLQLLRLSQLAKRGEGPTLVISYASLDREESIGAG